MASLPFFAFILAVFLLPTTVHADRFNTTAQRWAWMTGTPNELRLAARRQKLRITDLELIGRNPITYAAVMVDNSGANAIRWYLYTDLRLNQLLRASRKDSSRLIELESYFLSTAPGAQQLFSAVGIPNVGPRFSTLWGYSLNYDARQIKPRLRNGFFKIVDIDTFSIFGRNFYSFLTVENARMNKAVSRFLLHTTPEAIMKKAKQTNSRVIDTERHFDGKYTAVMEVMKKPVKWFWIRGVLASSIDGLAQANMARVYDLEAYEDGPLFKYDVLLIRNEL
ncbi:unnamed protein product [Chondrus crispus]|uniref:Outer membrane lipoprotein-sorting protein n=1 Tax=Chondrus crispus TaxID=2769 RepID=R7Q339_CHOCR|nr:unnamed protein product [Chondrus crispus]CDF32962.1 unnamed protein product [Chondrus crispus]|eukprot:XP_005712765.1 unnamed protein product [Chondrus crispus]